MVFYFLEYPHKCVFLYNKSIIVHILEGKIIMSILLFTAAILEMLIMAQNMEINNFKGNNYTMWIC